MPNKPFPTKKQFSSHNLLTKGKILFRKKLCYVCNYKIFTENIQAVVPTRISPVLKVILNILILSLVNLFIVICFGPNPI